MQLDSERKVNELYMCVQKEFPTQKREIYWKISSFFQICAAEPDQGFSDSPAEDYLDLAGTLSPGLALTTTEAAQLEDNVLVRLMESATSGVLKPEIRMRLINQIFDTSELDLSSIRSPNGYMGCDGVLNRTLEEEADLVQLEAENRDGLVDPRSLLYSHQDEICSPSEGRLARSTNVAPSSGRQKRKKTLQNESQESGNSLRPRKKTYSSLNENLGRPSRQMQQQATLSHWDHSAWSRLDDTSLRPRYISKVIETRLGECSPELVNLFFSVASPEAFCYLQMALRNLRTTKKLYVLNKSAEISQVVNGLDKLEGQVSTLSWMRRFFLLLLARLRHQVEQDLRKREIKKSNASHMRGRRTFSTKVIDKMVEMAHSARVEPQKIPHGQTARSPDPRTSTKNRLFTAKNWEKLRERHSMVAVALALVGGSAQITTQQFESIKDASFDYFLTILDDMRGPFLREVSARLSSPLEALLEGRDHKTIFRFEEIDLEVLRNMCPDSDELLEICRVVEKS